MVCIPQPLTRQEIANLDCAILKNIHEMQAILTEMETNMRSCDPGYTVLHIDVRCLEKNLHALDSYIGRLD